MITHALFNTSALNSGRDLLHIYVIRNLVIKDIIIIYRHFNHLAMAIVYPIWFIFATQNLISLQKWA